LEGKRNHGRDPFHLEEIQGEKKRRKVEKIVLLKTYVTIRRPFIEREWASSWERRPSLRKGLSDVETDTTKNVTIRKGRKKECGKDKGHITASRGARSVSRANKA